MPHDTIELSLVPLPAVAPSADTAARPADCPTRLAAARHVFLSAVRFAPPCLPAVEQAGPGWFDSSWDLRRGLEVREGWPRDAPLRGWIEAFLGAQPGAAGAESLSVA
jgi:hypothetical protein